MTDCVYRDGLSSSNKELCPCERTVISAEWRINVELLASDVFCVVCHLCVRSDRQLLCCVESDGCDVSLNCTFLSVIILLQFETSERIMYCLFVIR